jgi:hypothetical protein
MPIHITAPNVDAANARLKKALDASDANAEAGLAKLFSSPARHAPTVSAQPAAPHESAGWKLSRKDNGRRDRRF